MSIFKFDNLKQNRNQFVTAQLKRVDMKVSPLKAIFTLAGLFVLLGVGVALFPRFFAIIFGTFLIFFGAIFALLAWKLYKFKQRLNDLINKTNVAVAVSSAQPAEDPIEILEEVYEDIEELDQELTEEEEAEFLEMLASANKKITLH